MPRILNTLALFAIGLAHVRAAYKPLREYSGQHFFDNWDWYNFVDNTTWGNVTYVDQATATSAQLAFVDNQGNAIIRVDNTTNIPRADLVNRPTVRITSKDSYQIGSLFIADVNHIPYGCSVWPSFWTLGIDKEWPHAGEIDIIEGINLMGNNQMSVHTDPGCAVSTSSSSRQGGPVLNADCSQGRGCSVAEVKDNSFGETFAQNGGGVFAMQLDVGGINIWFWARQDIPKSISSISSFAPPTDPSTITTTLDTSDFGLPSAAFPASSCEEPLSTYFTPQNIVIDITLCGHWAGLDNLYSATCPGTCIDNVFGTGNPTYNNAFFSFNYIKTFTAENVTQTTSPDDVVVPDPSAAANASAAASNSQETGGADHSGKSPSSASALGTGRTGCGLTMELILFFFGGLMSLF